VSRVRPVTMNLLSALSFGSTPCVRSMAAPSRSCLTLMDFTLSASRSAQKSRPVAMLPTAPAMVRVPLGTEPAMFGFPRLPSRAGLDRSGPPTCAVRFSLPAAAAVWRTVPAARNVQASWPVVASMAWTTLRSVATKALPPATTGCTPAINPSSGKRRYHLRSKGGRTSVVVAPERATSCPSIGQWASAASASADAQNPRAKPIRKGFSFDPIVAVPWRAAGAAMGRVAAPLVGSGHCGEARVHAVLTWCASYLLRALSHEVSPIREFLPMPQAAAYWIWSVRAAI